MTAVPPRKALKTGFTLFVVVAAVVFVATYIGVNFGSPFAHEQVALVRVEGPIMDSREVVKTIQRYQRSPQVRALVLRVDSPGGGVVASQEIHNAVHAFREAGKVVVVSMGTVAASGGYYISVPANLIVANPGTLTGSIGVIMSLPNVEKLMDKVGVANVTIKAGENKDIGSPFRSMHPAETALMQGLMDDIHEQFIAAVAEGRDKPVATIRPLADGRVFTGRQAKAAGLVDEMGDLAVAVRRAGELAHIPGKPKVIEAEAPFWERVLAETRTLLPWPSAAALFAGAQPMYMMWF